MPPVAFCRSRFFLLAVIFVTSHLALAGGPAFVAGSGYNQGVMGQPLVWANGAVYYYTDQGALSPILNNSQANSLVATAFAAWTVVPGTTITVTAAGQLAEDVNGANIQTNGDGVVTAPADITPQATGTPVGIVYDYDGTVTDAILGEGAGEIADCFTNAVYGGPDNFSAAGNIVHSLVVINGVCAAASAQLPDLQYRLVRVLGRTLGLGWSQANDNVLTNNPPPTTADDLGFPIMHYKDSIACVPITVCYGGVFEGALGNGESSPAMDDADSLARLYPVSSPENSGHIYGNVYFTNSAGEAGQAMQGVNVVARLMVSGQPSRQYVATSVSGFLFCGNAGNIIDGYIAPNGLPYNQWGSSNPVVEGFFDLGQLPIQSGQPSAQYQVSVEALDPVWSLGVEPYATDQVTPSGSFAPITITVTNGSENPQTILMLDDAVAQNGPGSSSTYSAPAALPLSGAWGSWIAPYGSTDFFQFTAQANRTASIAVTALNEAGQPTENKMLPVIGVWELSDDSGEPAPASTPSAFNTETYGMTRLDVQFNDSEAFRVGIADFRGDGRPDYFYQANLLYSNSLTPARISVAGGVTTLTGIGFGDGLQINTGNGNGTVFTASATQLQVSLPPAPLDELATLQVTNPVTGSYSQMIGAVTYGAAPSDLLLLLQGTEPSTPVGAQAANPLRVRAVASDGVTPVSGATIAWSATNNLQFSVCGGISSCSVLTDAAGESMTWVTPGLTGPSTVTVALAPASYSPAQTQQATVMGTSTTLDLAAVTPSRWIAQGASLSVPMTVQALDLGVGLGNQTINFTITRGSATLSSATATTNSAGFASVNASFTNLSGTIQVSACVAPNNSPCVSLALFAVPSSAWKLQTVSGAQQIVPVGQGFQPLAMRVTDGSSAQDPVMGVSVVFSTTLAELSSGGEQGPPILLGNSQAQAMTDQNGMASIIPSTGYVGACDVFINVTAGQSNAEFELESVPPMSGAAPERSGGNIPGKSNAPRVGEENPS